MIKFIIACCSFYVRYTNVYSYLLQILFIIKLFRDAQVAVTVVKPIIQVRNTVNTDKIPVYQFPKAGDEREQCKKVVPNANLNVTDNNVVCQLHWPSSFEKVMVCGNNAQNTNHHVAWSITKPNTYTNTVTQNNQKILDHHAKYKQR